MDTDAVLQISREAMFIAVSLATPLLLSALVIGLIVGLFQAATQIQEMTLSFIPKLLALVVTLAVAGPWMLQEITVFTRQLILSIPGLIG